MYTRLWNLGFSGGVNVKIVVFCEVKPCNPVDIRRRFGGMYCFHIQGRKYVKQAGATNQLTRNLFICALFNFDINTSDNIEFNGGIMQSNNFKIVKGSGRGLI
jgi:hypothetical protein